MTHRELVVFSPKAHGARRHALPSPSPPQEAPFNSARAKVHAVSLAAQSPVVQASHPHLEL